MAARTSSRRWMGLIAVLAVAGVGAVALFALPTAFASAGSTPAPAASAAAFDKEWSLGPAKSTAAPAEPVYGTVGSPLSMDDPYEGFVPVQCPEGTVAGSTDVNGNQSDCQTPATPDGATTGG